MTRLLRLLIAVTCVLAGATPVRAAETKQPGSRVIYVQGADYLRRYRDTVGASKFWRGLANYYSAYRHRIGGTRQLLDALDAA